MFGLAGFAKDQVLGAEYVKVAADGGYEPAMLVEATLLDFGNGVPKDEDLAERYLRRAALAGNTNADILLGLKLLNKPPSAAKAAEGVKWLLVADFEGCEQGLHLVAQLSKNLPKRRNRLRCRRRNRLESEASATRSACACRRSDRWLPSASGHRDSVPTTGAIGARDSDQNSR
jgi:TPR repeat protein